MQFNTFYSLIPKLKTAKLGGVSAQFLLAPAYRKAYDLVKIKAANPTKAAVLIVVFPNAQEETCFVLTQRASYNGHHSQQISFPGGKQEKEDRSLFMTALRETKEEIGIKISPNSLIKTLTEVYIPPSNFLVTPHVVVLDKAPKFTPNYEVEKVLTPTLSQLLDDATVQVAQVQTTAKKNLSAPSFLFEDKAVWGATAMMLSELKELVLNS